MMHFRGVGNFKQVTVIFLSAAVVATSLLVPIQQVNGETLPVKTLLDQFRLPDDINNHQSKQKNPLSNLSQASAVQLLALAEPGKTAPIPGMPNMEQLFSTSTFDASRSLMPDGSAPSSNMPALGMPASNTPATGAKEKAAPAAPILNFPIMGMHTLKRGGQIVLKTGIEASKRQDIELTLGKAVIINTGAPVARVSISDPTVASAVVLSPTQIQLVGNKVGVANLLLWSDTLSDQYITADLSVHRDVSTLSKQLQLLDPGINVTPLAAEDTVILSGSAESKESVQLALQLANAFFSKGSGAGTSGPVPSTGNASTSSLAAGSATPGAMMPNIINLLKVKGEPTTKIGLLRERLKTIDPNIQVDLVPGPNGEEKVLMTGMVRTPGVISNAINTASVMYGKPGLQVVTGPGGNLVKSGASSPSFQTNDAFNTNIDVNILQGSIVTDASGNVVSLMTVSQKPQIKCSIKFLDVSRTLLKQLGNTIIGGDSHKNGYASFSGAQNPATGKTVAAFGGSAGYVTKGSALSATSGGNALTAASGFGQALGSGITQIFSLRDNLALAISALEEDLKARSLAEPTITMLSGEKSSFLAGGEVPIPVLGANGQISVTYHEYGVRLNIIATVTEDGKINMQFAPEISSVDLSIPLKTNIVEIPAFKSRRMQTTLELRDGESFMLAGLFNQEETTSASQFPMLGNVPIVGNFLKNKWKTKNDDEMIVIIKPEIVMIPNTPQISADSAKKIAGELIQGTLPVTSPGKALSTSEKK